MPDSGKGIIEALNNLPPEAAGALMSMFIAIVRVIYDNKETSKMQIFLEALICGGLSLTASYGIMAMDLNINWAIFAGGTIGYFGSASVRQVALILINKKVDQYKG